MNGDWQRALANALLLTKLTELEAFCFHRKEGGGRCMQLADRNDEYCNFACAAHARWSANYGEPERFNAEVLRMLWKSWRAVKDGVLL